MQILLFAVLLIGTHCPTASLLHTTWGSHAQLGVADVALSDGIICDPGCGDLLSLHIENRGPDVASQVVLEFEIPGDARLYEVSVDYPHRITRPGSGAAGAVTIEFESLPVDAFVSIDVYCSNPLEEGWEAEVQFRVRADQTDPTPDDNTYTQSLSTPYQPVVDRIRELKNPYRI